MEKLATANFFSHDQRITNMKIVLFIKKFSRRDLPVRNRQRGFQNVTTFLIFNYHFIKKFIVSI